MMLPRAGLLLLFLLLVACDSLVPEAATLTPTRAVSGPTIEPSATVLNLMPTEAPPDIGGPGKSIPDAAGVPFGSQIRPIELTPSADQMRQGMTPVQITLHDGQVVIGDLYENLPVQLEQELIQQRLPGIMLLGSPKGAWRDLPLQIRDAGYTVLVVDLGLNATSDDFALTLLSLSEANSVNPGLMAAVGLDDGADLALIGCAVDLLCDTVVLISPRSRDTLVNLMANFNPRPLMVVASQEHAESYQTALALRNVAAGDFSLQEYPGAARGLELIETHDDLGAHIIAWLERTLIE
jgi:hypothetical protein